MPRTKLGDKYSKPKVPPPNYLSELLKRHKKAIGVSSEEMARELCVCSKTVNNRLNQKPEEWSVGDIKRYCEILGIPFADAMDAATRSIGV